MRDLVGQRPVRCKGSALALDGGNLIAQACGQVGEFLGPFQDVLAAEAQQQAHVEDFERLQARGTVSTQFLQLDEEGLTGKLLAKQHELQRAALPRRADREVGRQDGFVHGRTEGVLGVEHIFGRHVQALGAAVELVQERAYTREKVFRTGGLLAIAQLKQHEEAVIEQVQQRARMRVGFTGIGPGIAGCGCRTAKQRRGGGSAHEVTAISSSLSSRMPAGA